MRVSHSTCLVSIPLFLVTASQFSCGKSLLHLLALMSWFQMLLFPLHSSTKSRPTSGQLKLILDFCWNDIKESSLVMVVGRTACTSLNYNYNEWVCLMNPSTAWWHLTVSIAHKYWQVYGLVTVVHGGSCALNVICFSGTRGYLQDIFMVIPEAQEKGNGNR